MASISPEVLLQFGGKLVSGSKLVLNVSVVFPKPKVMGRVDEGLCPGEVSKT